MQPRGDGAGITMTDAERDAFLTAQPICRVATLGKGGDPHLSALWFVWDGTALWFNSLVRSRRWTQLGRDSRVGAIVDDGGATFTALRGVELTGRAVVVGEVPRTGAPESDLSTVESLFADKYGGFHYDGRHAWLRLVPDRIASWDFAKVRRRSS
jgi:hypothetical protein